MNKDENIKLILALAQSEDPNWIVLDYWDSDMSAIGLAASDYPRRLVYISTFGKRPGRFYYECEVPAGPELTDFNVVEKCDDVDAEALLVVLRNHLSAPHHSG
jgi:hypothetical protein